ncbi:hypothetical protein BDZ91DRAFT_786606 [Kalaharituber pfeilii]|nr:hypothetical protein BDZ91DRAFT_786606 [Kalaharituber pfeilii]
MASTLWMALPAYRSLYRLHTWATRVRQVILVPPGAIQHDKWLHYTLSMQYEFVKTPGAVGVQGEPATPWDRRIAEYRYESVGVLGGSVGVVALVPGVLGGSVGVVTLVFGVLGIQSYEICRRDDIGGAGDLDTRILLYKDQEREYD